MAMWLSYKGAPSSVPVVASMSIVALTSSSTSMIFWLSAFRCNFFRCAFETVASVMSKMSSSRAERSTFHDYINLVILYHIL
jgi:hypothetical protein